MADFQYKPLTHSPERLNVIATKLGPDANTKYTDAEKQKAVKMGPVSNYLLCVDGNELEGFIDNIDAGPTAGGFVMGGVAHPNSGFRVEAKVGGATTLVVGDFVVAAAQAPVGTKSLPVVKKGTPATFKYRVINLYTGGGLVGSTVLLEKV